MSRSEGSCENPSCNQFNDGGCSRFRLDAVRDHRDLHLSGDLDRTHTDLNAGFLKMIGDHKGKIIGIITSAYYLVKKKNPLSDSNDLCDFSRLQGVVLGKKYVNDHAAHGLCINELMDIGISWSCIYPWDSRLELLIFIN